MKNGGGVLCYAEDPGAINFVAPVLQSLIADKLPVRVLSNSSGSKRFMEWSLSAESIFELASVMDKDPTLLVFGTASDPESLGLHLCSLAKSRGVPTLGFVERLSNANRRFQGKQAGSLAHAPEWLAVADHDIADAFDDLGFPRARLVVTGNPYHDVVRREAGTLRRRRHGLRRRLLPDVAADRPVVTFLSEARSQSNVAFYSRRDSYTLQGNGGSTDRTVIVAEEVSRALFETIPNAYRVFRPHPRDSADDIARAARDFDFVAKSWSALEVVALSDLVTGMTASLLEEAVFMGVPVVAIVPCPEEAGLLPRAAKKHIEVVWQRAAIGPALHSALTSDIVIPEASPGVCPTENLKALIHRLAPGALVPTGSGSRDV